MRFPDGDEADARMDETPSEGPLPNRLSRATLAGCLGIVCVLSLPALLFLPLESLRPPEWLVRSVPLVGLSLAGLGLWLMGQVPPGATQPPPDPLRPLTSAGRPPRVEHPATTANRVGLAVIGCLCLCCLAGYVIVSADTAGDRGILVGTMLTAVGGLALLVYAILAATWRVPVPAWRWVRRPAFGGIGLRPQPWAIVGFVALVWAMFVATSEGYLWASAGVGLLILGWTLSGLLTRRGPERGPNGRDAVSGGKGRAG